MTHKTKTQPVKNKQHQTLMRDYESKLAQAKERELKALADYTNLLKRQQQVQAQLSAVAGRELIEQLLSPLEHLSLAASHLQDQGVTMVAQEFWQVLKNYGLSEINPLNEPFSEETMEAVEKKGEGNRVKKVLRRGYKLNNQVIQPAKVVVG